MNMTLLTIASGSVDGNLSSGYIIGGIIALLLFGYLLYTLIKPEKF
jgi:K+-transporting ATPase KdpF subunit